MNYLAEIARLQAELDSLRPIPEPYRKAFQEKMRLDWTFHSNAIEGNSLTYAETKAVILHARYIGDKKAKDYREIEGHDDVVQSLEWMVKEKTPFSHYMVKNMHRQLLADKEYHAPAQTADGQETTKLIKPGEYKSTPNYVVKSNGEKFLYAEPIDVQPRLDTIFEETNAYLEQWDAGNKPEQNPITFAAWFHYGFILTHPFDDGNGRMARLLTNYFLMRCGYQPLIIRTEDKPEYLDALGYADATEGDTRDLVPFFQKVQFRVLDLWVRAAKGESIAEEGDWKKRLIRTKLLIEQNRQLGNLDGEKIKVVSDFVRDFISLITSLKSSILELNIFQRVAVSLETQMGLLIEDDNDLLSQKIINEGGVTCQIVLAYDRLFISEFQSLRIQIILDILKEYAVIRANPLVGIGENSEIKYEVQYDVRELRLEQVRLDVLDGFSKRIHQLMWPNPQ